MRLHQNIQKKCPIYFWRPWYPSSTFSSLLYNFDKLLKESLIKKIVLDLESNLQEYLKCDYLFLTPSGSASLFLINKAIIKKPEILLPSLVCDVVPSVIRKSGNSLNFLGINPSTYNIDVNDVQKKMTSNTGAILTVHQFGFPCQMDIITDIAQDRDCLIIEDAAQSFGAEYKGKKIGTIGDIGFFSFNNKVIDACGGGLIVTNNNQYYQKMNEIAKTQFSIDFKMRKIIRNLFRSWLISEFPQIGFGIGEFIKKEIIPELTTEINSITPLLLQNILPNIGFVLDNRRKNFFYYQNFLNDNRIVKPIWGTQIKPSFTFYTIRFPNSKTRNVVKSQLLEKGIHSEVLAQPTHHLYDSKLHLPETDLVANTMLSFPTDPHLDEKHIFYAADLINRILYAIP